MNNTQAKTLFDVPRSHRADPVTSYQAAEELVRSGKWTEQQRIVYEALKVKNGCTAAEIALWNKLDRYMVSRRLPELREKGLVVTGPARKCGLLNRPTVTWFLAGTFGPGKV